MPQWNYVSVHEFDSSLRDENGDIILDPTSRSHYNFTSGVGKTGDTLRVYAIKDGQYAYGYWDSEGEFVSTPGTIYMDNVYDPK